MLTARCDARYIVVLDLAILKYTKNQHVEVKQPPTSNYLRVVPVRTKIFMEVIFSAMLVQIT